MSAAAFDDARLEADDVASQTLLHHLAGAGARIRRASLSEPVGRLERADRPRGVLVLGAEARLIRAVLEPTCPVPFMAWPGPMVPAWVGPLDLVVVLGDHRAYQWEIECAAEAARRGAMVIVAAPADSALTVASASSGTTLIPTRDGDPVAAAVAVLSLLGQLALGPTVHAEHVADAADLVADRCSPYRAIGRNPGKDMAVGIGEGLPLVWGGTVLAARASRRIAESLRRASGRPALAADADELEAVMRGVTPIDPFADPFESDASLRPVLILLDEDKVPERVADVPIRLSHAAESVGVRVCRISSGDLGLGGTDVERYVTLLQQGRYAAAYLGIGLGRTD